LLLAKNKKGVEFMIPTPCIPMVGDGAVMMVPENLMGRVDEVK
jgi:hypothetical protein